MPIELLAGKNLPLLAARWRWLFFCAAGVIVVLLFYLGSKPIAVGLFPEPWDKLAHLVVFGGITALLWFATAGRRSLMVICVIAVIGAMDEWHQGSLPGRSMDYLDFLTDVAAAIVTVTALALGQK